MFIVKTYSKPARLSSTKRYLSYTHRPTTFDAVGIILPSDAHSSATGEVCITCPKCSANRRKSRDKCLSVNVTKEVWYCHHCGWKGGLGPPTDAPGRRTRRAHPKTATLQRTRPSSDAEAEAKAKRKRLRELWGQARSITADDPVGRYLKGRCAWQTPVPSVLRYHPHLPYRHDNDRYTYHPALVALIHAPDETAVGLQRIYLTPKGQKAPVSNAKKQMPSFTTQTGAAVRLDHPRENEYLAVAEGIETALAVQLSTRLPTWAAISADGMASLILPAPIRLVVVAADHDVSGKGQEAAYKLRDRLLKEGRQVKILIPETPGSDWADALMEGASHV